MEEELTGGRENDARRHARSRDRGRGAAVRAFLLIISIPVATRAAEAADPSPEPLPFAATSAADLRVRIMPADDRILILAPAALYRFQPESEAWTVTTTADGLPELPLGNLTITTENVWISGIGTSVSDLRFDDWQRYGSGEGYPGRVVADVEADDDYAYAGTDAGAARFDQYIREWETLSGPPGEPLGPVSDVAVGDDRVWFALERGVAEYRKATESFRIDSELGRLSSPRVIALRQTGRFVWAFAISGIARYDKNLQSWTSFEPGIDLPDSRVHQITFRGDDLWLGTDRGLWSYRADAGIWRRDESNAEMPGEVVHSFALRAGRIWVATERAFAVYEEETARWIEFTASVPLAPGSVSQMAWVGQTLVFLGREKIVYGLASGQENPSLFIYRSWPIRQLAAEEAEASDSGWRLGLDDEGLSLGKSEDLELHLKGGATIFVENFLLTPTLDSGFGELVSETRLDLRLNGRLAEDRTLSGFYDSTDPLNTSYQITYRGERSGVLRLVSFGEIDQQLFNSSLVPGTGLRGARVWSEAGPRSERTRRRLVAADAWLGDRRTFPGRDIFFGGNRNVEGETRDIDYVRGQVFPSPPGWTADDLRSVALYRDDDDPSTDDANTELRTIAGRAGAWDLLVPNADYVLGPGGETLLLASAITGSQALAAVAATQVPPGAEEVDLSDLWLRNHYLIGSDPVPGSLVIAIVDSLGSPTDGSGTSYLEIFGLDQNGDGFLDPERFSPITGLIGFPEERPFPPGVYADEPTSLFTLEYSYLASLNTFRLSHSFVVPRSERISVDRVLLKPDVDYSIIPASGLFVLFEHILLDDDTVIEVEYSYESGNDPFEPGGDTENAVLSGQIAVAPDDRLYFAANGTRWSDEDGIDQTTVGLNTRFEWRDEQSLLRLSPELAFSRSGTLADGAGGRTGDKAGGIAFQGRHRGLEVSASHRNLGGDFVSFEDRRTLLGRLREQSDAQGRLLIGSHLQFELDWERELSDEVAWGGALGGVGSGGSGSGIGGSGSADSLAAGRGEESLLAGTAWFLRSGWPNLGFRRSRILIDAPGLRQEKQVSRLELELSPEQAGVTPLGIQRLWLRSFFQRSQRMLSGEAMTGDSLGGETAGKQTTDHAFLRLNGSVGNPMAWNLALEDRRTFLPEEERQNLRRFQAVDATLQTEPHPSLDAFLRWEASRDLFWTAEGGNRGFAIRRLRLATLQLYPGQVTMKLSRLSFRLDAGQNDTESGEPGVPAPGAGSLWSTPSDISQGKNTRYRIIEGRLQILAAMRFVQRWEFETDRSSREGLDTERDTRRLENRLELRPERGLIILRFIGSRSSGAGGRDSERRFSGQWDQTWGRGILTYALLEAQRIETEDRLVGDRTQLWNPQFRITWRRSRWRLDASLGGSLTWIRTEDTSMGVGRGATTTRERSVSTSLSLYPLRILGVKLQYELTRSHNELPGVGLDEGWITNHDLRLQLQIRA